MLRVCELFTGRRNVGVGARGASLIDKALKHSALWGLPRGLKCHLVTVTRHTSWPWVTRDFELPQLSRIRCLPSCRGCERAQLESYSTFKVFNDRIMRQVPSISFFLANNRVMRLSASDPSSIVPSDILFPHHPQLDKNADSVLIYDITCDHNDLDA
jgi:hypothetical protein